MHTQLSMIGYRYNSSRDTEITCLLGARRWRPTSPRVIRVGPLWHVAVLRSSHPPPRAQHTFVYYMYPAWGFDSYA